MGWERYFLHDFFTARELNELEEKHALRSRFERQLRASTSARIAALENDLARVALLARALADVCIAKGVLTKEELMRQLLEADAADGKRDEKLAAKVVMPGESKPADPDPDPAVRKAKMKRKRPLP